jgi:hypothetical protein
MEKNWERSTKVNGYKLMSYGGGMFTMVLMWNHLSFFFHLHLGDGACTQHRHNLSHKVWMEFKYYKL